MGKSNIVDIRGRSACDVHLERVADLLAIHLAAEACSALYLDIFSYATDIMMYILKCHSDAGAAVTELTLPANKLSLLDSSFLTIQKLT